MKCELQLQYGLDTNLSFGSTFPTQKLGDWLNSLLIKYNGLLLRIHDSNSSEPQIFLKFSEIEQASAFFKEFNEKLAPRMFYKMKNMHVFFEN